MSSLYRNHLFFKNTFTVFISYLRFQHHLSFSTLATEISPPKTPFMIEYLINICGFSRERAINASTSLSINSSEKPDSVLNFLKNLGLSNTQITDVISRRPRLLCANVGKTLIPKVRIFQELGLSGPDLAAMIVLKPTLLCNSAKPLIDFLMPLLHSKEDVIETIKKSKWIISNRKIEDTMKPNISILQNCGASDAIIAKLLRRNPLFILQSPRKLNEIIVRVKKMGLSQESGTFISAVIVIGSMTKTSLEAKFEVYKSFGWSEADALSAFVRDPEYLKYSEQKVRKAMDYFLKELEDGASYVLLYPKLLSYSLEKRIIPWFNVFQILKSKGLLKRNYSFYQIVCLSRKKFFDKFVLPHKETAPEVIKAYMGSI